MMTIRQIERQCENMLAAMDEAMKRELLVRAPEIIAGDHLDVLIRLIEREMTMDDGFFDCEDRIECDW